MTPGTKVVLLQVTDRVTEHPTCTNILHVLKLGDGQRFAVDQGIMVETTEGYIPAERINPGTKIVARISTMEK